MEKKKMTRVEYQRRLRKKRRRLKPIPFAILILFFATIFIFSAYKLIVWQLDNNKINNLSSEIDNISNGEFINDEGEAFNPPNDKDSDYWYYIGLPFYNVDFDELLKKNKDTVAFIHMENNNINYPVVQTNDNSYYLTHAFDKSYNDAGWVFLDYRNNIDSLSFNNIIYGHGRLNKTVFGSLKDTLDKKWQSNKDNLAIYISTPKENMVFQIFSIYTIKSESYYISTSFDNEKDKSKWLDTMIQRNTSSINTSVDTNDKILTLSTCLDNNGGRVVVQAKLIKTQKRP